MKLTDLNESKKYQAQRALKEHYGVDYDLTRMNASKTKSMLTRVQGLISEARQQPTASHRSPAYLKLMMMEQMLSQHWNDVKGNYRVVVENEEVDKSQVILAAQEIVDSLQKMLEQISKTNVEELPAVVNGIESEIDSNASQSFNETVGGALTTLQGAIQQAKTAVQGALGSITGNPQGDLGGGLGGEEGGDLGGDLGELGGEEGGEGGELPELPEPEEEPEEPLGSAGRGLR
jgi:hypothetical protein